MRPGELELVLTDLKVHGLEAVTQLDEFHWDKEANTVSGQITVPNFHLTSNYVIKGRILVLPINGEGPLDFKMGK